MILLTRKIASDRDFLRTRPCQSRLASEFAKDCYPVWCSRGPLFIISHPVRIVGWDPLPKELHQRVLRLGK
jgi:hypothetical protein